MALNSLQRSFKAGIWREGQGQAVTMEWKDVRALMGEQGQCPPTIGYTHELLWEMEAFGEIRAELVMPGWVQVQPAEVEPTQPNTGAFVLKDDGHPYKAGEAPDIEAELDREINRNARRGKSQREGTLSADWMPTKKQADELVTRAFLEELGPGASG